MITRAEQETIIRWDEESDMATVYTASPRMAKKCETWGWPLGVYSTAEGQPRTWQGEVPKRAVRLAKRTTFEKKRPATEAALEALAKAREARQNPRKLQTTRVNSVEMTPILPRRRIRNIQG